MGYSFGRMTLTHDKATNRFVLEGDCTPHKGTSDHFQLIYEALEIAAHSEDEFNPEFADMVAELMNLSADWID